MVARAFDSFTVTPRPFLTQGIIIYCSSRYQPFFHLDFQTHIQARKSMKHTADVSRVIKIVKKNKRKRFIAGGCYLHILRRQELVYIVVEVAPSSRLGFTTTSNDRKIAAKMTSLAIRVLPLRGV